MRNGGGDAAYLGTPYDLVAWHGFTPGEPRAAWQVWRRPCGVVPPAAPAPPADGPGSRISEFNRPGYTLGTTGTALGIYLLAGACSIGQSLRAVSPMIQLRSSSGSGQSAPLRAARREDSFFVWDFVLVVLGDILPGDNLCSRHLCRGWPHTYAGD